MAKRNNPNNGVAIEVETLAQARELVDSAAVTIASGEKLEANVRSVVGRALDMVGLAGGIDGVGFRAMVSVTKSRLTRETLERDRAAVVAAEAQRRARLASQRSEAEDRIRAAREQLAEAEALSAATEFVPDAEGKTPEQVIEELRANSKSLKATRAEVVAQRAAAIAMWDERLKEVDRMCQTAAREVVRCSELMKATARGVMSGD